MPALYLGTFYSIILTPLLTVKTTFTIQTTTKALSRRTPAINMANYSTLPEMLSMLECTDLQNKVNTMLGVPTAIKRNPMDMPKGLQLFDHPSNENVPYNEHKSFLSSYF